ncbi:MAG: rRNA (uracil1498-N3)-methyltransferase [Verrucomicrobiota bacterium]|jgi:16S rRNA (uracil1498-N3)-methyltransferase
MHRFYVTPENWNPDAPILRGAEAHHAKNVLRLTRGDKVVLFNGRGREITAEIDWIASRHSNPPGPARPRRSAPAGSVVDPSTALRTNLSKDEIRLRKLHEAETPPLPCRITLGQAIPKGKNMDLIVQKAVEIGAAEIAPILSDRTIVQVDLESAAQKQMKWQEIAIEAAKQCGQNWLPQVRTPRKLSEFFAEGARFDLQLIGSLQSDALHLKKILGDYSAEHRQLPTSVLMLVGPEGDFTPAELALARSHGCQPITLGPIILRVETAAIYCLSVLSYELLV